MADEKLVEDIMNTYDLPHKLKNKITRIAIEQIDKFYLYGFDNAYECISNLVEKFKIPFREKNVIRGDKLISSDSRETFYDLMGTEDSVLSSLFGESENLSRTKSLDEIICILEPSLDKSDVELMRRLFNRNLLFYIREEDIIAKAPKIQERFRELMKTYERGGKLIIPRRPIVQIQFNPLFIKFKRRGYHGDPLAFFKKHEDVYGGMSREELISFDIGLYSALWRAKQLHVIPRKPKKNALAFFNEHKNMFEGMSRSELKSSNQSLYWALKRNDQLDIAIPRDNRYLSKKEINDIIEMLHVCDGNATLVSKNLKRGRNTIIKYLKLDGLKPYKRPSSRNPLYFFDTNQDLYRGLSRRELSIANPGLYKSLLKTGQINIAIPKLRKVGRPRKTA